MAYVKARIKIKGKKDLLWHKFSEESIPLERQPRTGVAGNDPEEWRRTVTYDKSTRQLYLEPMSLFSCIRDGARHIGVKGLQAKVSATLQVFDERVMINRYMPPDEQTPPRDSGSAVFLHVAPVRNPGSKARAMNIRYRVAVSPGWEAMVHIIWDTSIVAEHQMRAIVRDAGILSGLGNGRSIGYGRFIVVEFTVEAFDAEKETA